MKNKLLFFVIFLFSFFTFCLNVSADDVEITSVIKESSSGATDVTFGNSNISAIFETSLRYVNHYVQYRITFTNSSEYDYKIHLPENVEDKVGYIYQVDNDVITAGSTKEVVVKIIYNELYTNTEIHLGGESLLLTRSDQITMEKIEHQEPDPGSSSDSDESKLITQVLKVNQIKAMDDVVTDVAVLGEIQYVIKDESIATIENGEIVPHKVGDTYIEFDYNAVHYIIHVIVNEDDLIGNKEQENPNTKDIILITGIILGVSIIVYISCRNRKVGKYIGYVLVLVSLLYRFVPDFVYADDAMLEFTISFTVHILPQRYHVNRYETNSTQYSCNSCGSDHYYGETGTMTVRQARSQYIYTGQSYTSNSVFQAYFIPVSGTKRAITDENEVLKNESEGYYQFYYNRKVCLAGESLVIVYDEKKKKKGKKKLKDVNEDDLILCWDFDNGEFTFAKPLWIKKPELVDSYYQLNFEKGYSIKVIGDHKLFCVNKNKFINAGNDNEFEIGDSIYTANGEIVKLISHKKVFESIDTYNVITDYHLNMFADEILTSCVFSNIYEIDNMKYVVDNNKKVDVSKLNVEEKYIMGARLSEVPVDFKGSEEETIKYINEYFENLENKKR